MENENVVKPQELITITQGFERDGDIDPLSNIADDKIYIFSGTADTVVVPGTVDSYSLISYCINLLY